MDLAAALLLALCQLLAYLGASPVDAYRFTRDTSGEISVTTIKEEPFLFVKDPGGEGNDNFYGYIPDLLEKIALKTGLTFDMSLVPDGKYGGQESGRWNGMIGEVIAGRAELIAAPMTISDKRKEVLEFTTPIMSFNTVLLLKKPAEGVESPIKSSADLANQDVIKYGMIAGGSTENFFKTTQNPTFKKMWRAMNADSSLLVSNVADGVKRVRQSDGKYAFIMEGITADYWIQKLPCDLMKVDDGIMERHYGFAMAKGSSLKQRIDPVVNELKQNGDLDGLRRKWWDDLTQCGAASTLQISSVSLLLSALALIYFY